MSSYPNAGIYVFICRPTGQRYFGQTNDFKTRRAQHERDIANGTHVNPWLTQAVALYGWDNFDYAKLYIANDIGAEPLQEWLNRHETLCFNRSKAQGKWGGYIQSRREVLDFNVSDKPQGLRECLPYYVTCISDDATLEFVVENLGKFCIENGLNPLSFSNCANPLTHHRTRISTTTGKIYTCRRIPGVIYPMNRNAKRKARSYIFVVLDNPIALSIGYRYGDIIKQKNQQDMTIEFGCHATRLTDIANNHAGNPSREGFNKDGSIKYNRRTQTNGIKSYRSDDFPNHYPKLPPDATNIGGSVTLNQKNIPVDIEAAQDIVAVSEITETAPVVTQPSPIGVEECLTNPLTSSVKFPLAWDKLLQNAQSFGARLMEHWKTGEMSLSVSPKGTHHYIRQD